MFQLHQALSYSAVKLFSKNSNLVIVITVPKRYGQTDGQTDNILWYDRALLSIAR